MRTKIKHIHMVGICGSGMSGIAEVLADEGYQVQGSDLADGPVAARLRAEGIKVFIGHDAANVGQAQVVVKSSAINGNNPEIIYAAEHNVPIIPRAEMLAELMRLRTGIAVAGTHGKTTTTSLMATIFDAVGLDPTVIIGGRLNAYGSNAHLGQGEYLIAEADESDGSFLCLLPIISVVTNVDGDHFDYYADQNSIDKAFVQFMNQVPFYSLNVVCGDDLGVKRLLSQVKRPVMTYGFGLDNELRAEMEDSAAGSRFAVIRKDERLGRAFLTHPGRHNVLNALAAVGVAMQVGIPAKQALEGLEAFKGVGRRFECRGERDGVLVIDDYGHHPTEIAATLATARSRYPERRLVVLFQPHRFSRTKALFNEFREVLVQADKLVLLEIYPSSEEPIPGVTGLALAESMATFGQVFFTPDFVSAEKQLEELLRPGDLLLTLGAGNVWQIGVRYLEGRV